MNQFDLTDLKQAVDDYIEFVRSGEYNGDEAEDYKQYIFEAAIAAFYGPEIWAEIRAAQ